MRGRRGRRGEDLSELEKDFFNFYERQGNLREFHVRSLYGGIGDLAVVGILAAFSGVVVSGVGSDE